MQITVESSWKINTASLSLSLSLLAVLFQLHQFKDLHTRLKNGGRLKRLDSLVQRFIRGIYLLPTLAVIIVLTAIDLKTIP